MTTQVINFLVKQISLVASTAVKALKSHEFSVRVKNFPKSQQVHGTVVVGNQKKLEELLSKILKNGQKVENLHINGVEHLKLSGVDKEVKIINIDELKRIFDDFPKEFSISNPTTEVRINNLKELVEKIEAIGQALKDQKITPEITVLPTPINLPPTETHDLTALVKEFEETFSKLFSEDPKKYIPVRLSNGEDFYEAITQISGSLKRPQTISNLDPLGTYQIADKDTDSPTKYYGFTDKDGNWYILKEDSAAETYRYARGNADYSASWTDRASQEYDYFHEVF